MIRFDWGKYTAEFATIAEARKYIEEQGVDTPNTKVTFKAKVDLVHFFELAEMISDMEGKIL